MYICLPDAQSCACDSLSAFFVYVYTGIFYPMYKSGYMSVAIYHGIYKVGIRARFGWEGFMEEVSFG